MIMFDSRVD